MRIAGIRVQLQRGAPGWPVEPRPLLVLDAEGNDLGRPDGGYRYFNVRGGSTPGGEFHVIWGESEGDSDLVWTDYTSAYPSELRHAVYSKQRGWTDAEVVYAPGEALGPRRERMPTLDMQWSDRSPLTFNEAEEIRLAVSHPGSHSLAVLRQRSGGWSSSEIPARGSSPSIAARREGILYVAYIALPLSGEDAQQLRIVASPDDGDTWSPPMLITRLPEGHADRPRLFIGEDGFIHVLWTQNLSGGVFAEAIRHSHTEDGGRTWSTPSAFAFPSSFTSWDVIADDCGGLHIAYAAGAVVEYAYWNGSWTDPEVIYQGDQKLYNPVLMSGDEHGSIHIIGTVHTNTMDDPIPEFSVVEMSLTSTRK